MATIDPNIALSVKPVQIQDPLNRMAAMMQIEGGQQSQQLNALKIKEAERELTENEGIRNYLAGANLNTPEGRGGLRQFGKTGLTYEKLLADQEKAGLERTKLKGEISEQDRVESREGFKSLVFNPSDNNVLAYLEDSVLKGKITPAQKEQQWQSVASMDEAQRKQHFTMLSLKADKYFELNKPQYIQENLGGVNRVSAFPGMGGAPTVVSQAARTATPGELMTDARARERLTLDQDKATRDLTMGTIPAGYRLNKVTNELEAIPGGPTTVPLSPKDKQKREAAYPKATSGLKAFDDTSNSLIKDLAELRDHPGLSSITGIAAGRAPGITKNGRAAQALYDKIVARGGFQALTDLKAAGGTLGAVSNQEGTQLKDSWAAINRTQDADDVRKALDQALATVQTSKDRIRDEYESTYEYRNTVPRSNAASSAAPATPNAATVNIKSNAEYDALPSGTIFIDPNGQQRRKP
jgi:hypothetical protein